MKSCTMWSIQATWDHLLIELFTEDAVLSAGMRYFQQMLLQDFITTVEGLALQPSAVQAAARKILRDSYVAPDSGIDGPEVILGSLAAMTNLKPASILIEAASTGVIGDIERSCDLWRDVVRWKLSGADERRGNSFRLVKPDDLLDWKEDLFPEAASWLGGFLEIESWSSARGDETQESL